MKNMDHLEEFVKNHRNEFDRFEPSPMVWEKIKSANREKKSPSINYFLFRIAAIIVLVCISGVLILTQTRIKKEESLTSTDPQIEELLETERFYSHQISGKLQEIRKCYQTFPELKNDIESDLNELEKMYFSLKNDLKDNVSNKPVIEAMIENNRVRLKLVDSVLEQIKC
jgi:hypothetical protein